MSEQAPLDPLHVGSETPPIHLADETGSSSLAESLRPTEAGNFDMNLFAAKLKEFAPAVAADVNLIFLPTTDSTMNEPRRSEERDGALKAGQIFVAGEQTAGTGQDGKWFTGPADVAMTIVVDNIKDAATRALFSFHCGVAVANALRKLCPEIPELCVKWPNDVFAREGARKICGILSVSPDDTAKRSVLIQKGYFFPENHQIIGIGINLGDHVKRQEGLRGDPTSVETLTGRRISREEVIAAVVGEIAKAYEQDLNPAYLVQDVQRNLYTAEDGNVFIDLNPEETRIEGIITEVTKSGLQVQTAEEKMLISFDRIVRIYLSEDLRKH